MMIIGMKVRRGVARLIQIKRTGAGYSSDKGGICGGSRTLKEGSF